MDKLIIVGVETIIGGNTAAWLSDRFDVRGVSFGESVQIQGCETTRLNLRDTSAICAWVAKEAPQWILIAGPWTESPWAGEVPVNKYHKAAHQVAPWVEAAAIQNCACTVLSSDAVFTGPWMFHGEESPHFCATPVAQSLKQMEQTVAELYPAAMIVRTHAFGWSPSLKTVGVIEQTLAKMFDGKRLELDCVRHATPILATDLAEILELSYRANLTGVYHIGGAERLSPYRLGMLLASQFGGAYTPSAPVEPLTERSSQFGAGETSLQSTKIRRDLGVSLPLIQEGLERLHAQSLNGFRDQFGTGTLVSEGQLVA